MFVNRDHQSPRDRRTPEKINQTPPGTLPPSTPCHPVQTSANVDREVRHTPHLQKLAHTQFAQFLNSLLEFSSELTYFAINAFQTSSLRRAQITTLQRFNRLCVPRVCAFYYNLDTEFDSFVQKMRHLCGRAKQTFLDLRATRIHSSKERMKSLPITHRFIDVFKCNVNRLRDIKQLHREIGNDLLLPNDQLFLALDLMVTDFELLNCELEAQVRFADAMILQTIIKVKYAAYRPDESNGDPKVRKCDQPKKRSANRSVKASNSADVLRRHANQNFADETTSDCRSEKHQKKKRRKHATRSCVLPTATDDLQRYLHEKRRHDVGIIHINKSKSNKHPRRMVTFNQVIQNLCDLNEQ